MPFEGNKQTFWLRQSRPYPESDNGFSWECGDTKQEIRIFMSISNIFKLILATKPHFKYSLFEGVQGSIIWKRGWQIDLRNVGYCYVQTLLSAILYKTRNIRMHQIVIIRIISWGCETWKLQGKHQLRVSENRGPNNIILALNYVRLGERFSSLYSLSNTVTAIKSKRMIWAEHTERMEELGYVARKTWRERLCGRLSIAGRINVKIDLTTSWVVWIKLAQYRVRRRPLLNMTKQNIWSWVS